MSISRIAYRIRGLIIPLPIIFSLFCFSLESEVDLLIWPTGVSIFLLGIFLRVWAQQHLHYRLRVKKSLTTSGPYSFIRNPIYSGNILICVGLIVISELLWLIPIVFFYCFGLYSLVVQYEERHLLEKYGESYFRYISEVPRWIPKISYLRKLRHLDLTNRYFYQSLIVEFPNLFLILPFIIKEIISISMNKFF